MATASVSPALSSTSFAPTAVPSTSSASAPMPSTSSVSNPSLTDTIETLFGKDWQNPNIPYEATLLHADPPNRPIYIAYGFLEDVTKLLITFSEIKTTDFTEFAEIWKNMHFSLVFGNRSSEVELCEYTNEVFVITSKFLLIEEEYYMNIGAVYALYCLYRHQLFIPKIKIRLEMQHVKVLQFLREEAISKKNSTLHYVIDFLYKEAIAFAANQTLKGPSTRPEIKKKRISDELIHFLNTYKSDFLKYTESHGYGEITELKQKYIDLKKKYLNLDAGYLKEDFGIYENAVEEMHDLKHPTFRKKNDWSDKRSRLKSKAFSSKVKAFRSKLDDSAGIANYEEHRFQADQEKVLRRTRVKRRPPKEQRRAGRPRKRLSESPKQKSDTETEVDISHLLEEQMKIFAPLMTYKGKNIRTRRFPYYLDSKTPKKSSILRCVQKLHEKMEKKNHSQKALVDDSVPINPQEAIADDSIPVTSQTEAPVDDPVPITTPVGQELASARKQQQALRCQEPPPQKEAIVDDSVSVTTPAEQKLAPKNLNLQRRFKKRKQQALHCQSPFKKKSKKLL